MPSLRELLEVSWALPADVADDGTALVRWNVPGSFQLYLVPPGGEPVQLTDFDEPVNGLFVPGSGGDRLLLSMDAGGNERAQLYLLDAVPGATLEPLVVEPELLHSTPRFDATGHRLAYACNRRNGRDLDVYVRTLATGDERCAFAPGSYCEVAGFSPDGRWLAVLRLTENTGDNDLHLVDLVDGVEILVAPDEHDAAFGPPVWTQDSSAFLFATSSGRDTVAIARFELATGEWRYVIEDDWDLECAGGGGILAVHANVDGYSRLDLHDLESASLDRHVDLPERGMLQTLVVSPGGRHLAVGLSSPRTTWDAWLVDTGTGAPVRLTRSPTTVARGELADATLARFSSFDGESIPFLTYHPGGSDPAPVLIEIHGGPEAQRRPMWIPLVQYLAGQGLAVVQPNVRGSTGYGKRFEHLDDGRRRLDTVRDVAALHDHLGSDARFDADRTVLYGGSYGGYMVLACLAFEPERWAGGVAVVPISSFVTFLRNTSEYRRAFREREYGSLEHDLEFLVEASPITHVDRIRAPLMLVHGANDPRVPLSEAEQIHTALGERGLRTELLVYDDEGHGLQKLPNKLDAYPRVVAFVDEILGRTGT